MVDATTTNILLATPARGTDSGTWDVPVNGNMSAIDGIVGGKTTISLSSATTILLTTPATGTISAGAGPNQSENAVIKLTGTLTGNCIIQLAMPKKYVVDNRCTVSTFYVQLSPSAGTGNSIGAPPGEKVEVFYDGTDVDYINLNRVGSAVDLHGVTALPAWMNACTVAPYLIKNGTVYTSSVYPALSAMLGSTFGGNGITTFAVPDEMSRIRLPIDTGTTGRVTSAISGINGTTMGSAGGDQQLQTHTHGITDPKHTHVLDVYDNSGSTQFVTGGSGGALTHVSKASGSASTGITINAFGTGSSQNMPPAIVSFLPLIKT